VNSQNTDGSWSDPEINRSEVKKPEGLSEEVFLTILALKILNDMFSKREGEFKLVMKKALKYLRKCKVEDWKATSSAWKV
jgi:hypothetical protein